MANLARLESSAKMRHSMYVLKYYPIDKKLTSSGALPLLSIDSKTVLLLQQCGYPYTIYYGTPIAVYSQYSDCRTVEFYVSVTMQISGITYKQKVLKRYIDIQDAYLLFNTIASCSCYFGETREEKPSYECYRLQQYNLLHCLFFIVKFKKTLFLSTIRIESKTNFHNFLSLNNN
jgi:hypothetical protein